MTKYFNPVLIATQKIPKKHLSLSILFHANSSPDSGTHAQLLGDFVQQILPNTMNLQLDFHDAPEQWGSFPFLHPHNSTRGPSPPLSFFML